MTRTFIKLHGAWSGDPAYLDVSAIISVGRDPDDLSETLVTFSPYCTARVSETPDDVAALLGNLSGITIVEDPDYAAKHAAALAAIAARAAAKTTEEDPA